MVGQAIMRLRSDDDEPADATVIVNTAALPDWISIDELLEVPNDHPLQSPEQRRMVKFLMENGEATANELVNKATVSRMTVSRAKEAFKDKGWVEENDTPGPYANTIEWIA